MLLFCRIKCSLLLHPESRVSFFCEQRTLRAEICITRKLKDVTYASLQQVTLPQVTYLRDVGESVCVQMCHEIKSENSALHSSSKRQELCQPSACVVPSFPSSGISERAVCLFTAEPSLGSQSTTSCNSDAVCFAVCSFCIDVCGTQHSPLEGIHLDAEGL